ncbi:uncharacterized protein LOC118200718 [Stegodyphus dumicola]|uniref:uncharacterized protein LOC118200718 n=1 Tax=Stegodyphus dumicola TaxID=202533 RepID=UPI0015B13EAA|nr:uncharacterized protein LOC118200718 [Stegodyphus dumicola]
MCGAVCTYGTGSSATVSARKGCKLYRRYDNTTFIPSMELLVDNIKNLVEEHLLKLMLKGKDDKMIQVEVSSFEVTYPGEDDSMFYRIGNELNPRMRVLKAGAKLKAGSGNVVKNLGKLRYDECQRVCLDFKDCETVSYCLKTSECIVSKKYGEDIKSGDMEDDTFCNLLTRKYADNFDRSPGIVLSLTAKKEIKASTLEECARACITETGFKCLSFDHCPQGDDKNCRLHTVHYPNPKTRESVQEKKPICGHYTRKFSTEFKKNPEKRYVGAKLPPLSNVTLEECAKSCVDYGKGACYGFDFCQDRTILATTCTLLDSDPSRMKSSYNPVCTNFLRTEAQYAPRPYTTGYAGGIAFLCLLVGIIVGCVCVFGIAYMRVNRR